MKTKITLTDALRLDSGLTAARIQELQSIGKVTPRAVVLLASLCFMTDNSLPILPAAHHLLWLKLMCDQKINQLLILAPPESAKTTWVAAFLGTFIGFFPELNTIIASSSGLIAARRSQSLRNLVTSPVWQHIFPKIKKAAGMEWNASAFSLAPDGIPFPGRLHPTVSSYGTGGSIIGARADVVIADDLLDFDNSRTPGSREFVQSWMHSSLLTRRKSGDQPGRTIVVGTSWRQADLYNSLIVQGDWVSCRMPILSTEEDGYYAFLTYPEDWPHAMLGEIIDIDSPPNKRKVRLHNDKVIWPSRKPLTAVLALQKSTPPIIFASTYQQSNTAALGTIFPRFWWSYWQPQGMNLPSVYEVDPEGKTVEARLVELPARFDSQLQSWDLSFTEKKSSAMNVGQVWGKRLEDTFLLDMVRGHFDMPTAAMQVEMLARKWKGARPILIEAKANGPAVLQTLRRKVSGLVGIEPKGDKQSRANAITPYVMAGNVFLPHPSLFPWVQVFIDEMSTFPSSQYADIVDTATQAIQRIYGVSAKPATRPFSGAVITK